jgi:hypothetical protein
MQELLKSGGFDLIAAGGKEKPESLAIECYNPKEPLLQRLLNLIPEALNGPKSIT